MRTGPLTWGLTALLTTPLLVAACAAPEASVPSRATGTPTSAAAAATSSGSGIDIAVFQFRPKTLEVQSGTRVTWTNTDDILHTSTEGTAGNANPAFDLQLDGKGTTASFTFERPGTYSYFCNIHQQMRGEVIVR